MDESCPSCDPWCDLRYGPDSVSIADDEPLIDAFAVTYSKPDALFVTNADAVAVDESTPFFKDVYAVAVIVTVSFSIPVRDSVFDVYFCIRECFPVDVCDPDTVCDSYCCLRQYEQKGKQR